MKLFKGTPVNVEKAILAKVIKSSERKWCLWKAYPEVYVADYPPKKLPKAVAYIFAGNADSIVTRTQSPVLYEVPSDAIGELNDGDVVMIEKDGSINVLYEKASQQNVIFATNRCNLNCIMCPQPSTTDEEGMHSRNLKLIRMMSPESTKSIAISGGEPTLLAEAFCNLIRACKENLPKTSLMVLTNGTRLKNMEFVTQVMMITHPDLTFAVPLYSDVDIMHDKIVGVPQSFYDAIKGLHNLALFRHRVEIRTVVTAINHKRLPNLAEFIYRNLPFVTHVAIMGLEVTGNARRNYADIWIDPFHYTSELEKAVRILNRANLNVSIYNHQLCTLPQSLWRFCRQSISSWKNVYVDKCNKCLVKDKCGGFFQTSEEYISDYIKPIF